jgi:uncharacterized protein involved in type VI secretion and phage assembly
MSMQERAMKSLLEGQRRQFFGKYRGVVVDNRDDNKQGRLQVQVPQVLGDAKVWAWPCVPFAGKDVGFFAMPERDTGVWVEFEAGDPSFPIWTGFWWAKGDIATADADPSIKFFRTKKFTLRIDDQAGEIRFENKTGGPQPGSQITLTAVEIKLKSSSIKVEGAGGRTLTIDTKSLRVHENALEVI